MENCVENHLERVDTMEDLDNPKDSEYEKNIQHDVGVLVISPDIVHDVEDEGGSNDDSVEHVPVFGDEHCESECVNLEQNFNGKYCQEPPFNVFVIREDNRSIDKDDGIKQVSEIFVFNRSDDDFGIFMAVDVWDESLKQIVLHLRHLDVEKIWEDSEL